MNSLDFQNGLTDAAELCEREAPRHTRNIPSLRMDGSELSGGGVTVAAPESHQYRRAAQACREAIKLREAVETALQKII